jgi:hypothetical protein
MFVVGFRPLVFGTHGTRYRHYYRRRRRSFRRRWWLRRHIRLQMKATHKTWTILKITNSKLLSREWLVCTVEKQPFNNSP